MLRFLKLATLLFAIVPVVLFAQQVEDTSSIASENKSYQLRPSDVFRVRVHQEEDLTQEVRVSQDYTVSLPLIGTLSVKDKTVQEVEMLIRNLYAKDYLQNPQVNVIVLSYSERLVSVIGQVNRPGPVVFPPEKPLTLLDAIAQAGGFTRLGNAEKVSLTRVEDGVSKTYIINVKKMLDSRKGASTSASWPLQVGDVINVPEIWM